MDKSKKQLNNEMIAKFMGGQTRLIHSHTPVVEFRNHPKMGRHNNNLQFHVKFLSYHKSMDWLIPVVEYIESLGFDVTIQGNQCSIIQNTLKFPGMHAIIHQDKTKIDAVYGAILEFIETFKKKSYENNS